MSELGVIHLAFKLFMRRSTDVSRVVACRPRVVCAIGVLVIPLLWQLSGPFSLVTSTA